jgi:hypothetical protein
MLAGNIDKKLSSEKGGYDAYAVSWHFNPTLPSPVFAYLHCSTLCHPVFSFEN